MKLYGENKAVACVPVVKQRSDWVASAARHGSVRAGGFGMELMRVYDSC